MKRISYKFLLIVIATNAMNQNMLFSINFSAISKGITKGVEIAGHVATGIDVAMNIASVGVTLWGSEKDQARMAKGMQISGLITSIAQGDFETAEAHAQSMRGSKAQSDAFYIPIPAEELAEADIVLAPEASSFSRRSFGDINIIPNDQLQRLRASEKTITINDTKLAQFGILKNQLVFEARLPQNINEEKMYKLMNNVEVIFKAVAKEGDPSKLNIICYRLVPKNRTSYSKTGHEITETVTLKKEFVTIALPKSDLQKNFFFGTTNNELSIFHKEGNDIIKTTLIQKMVE